MAILVGGAESASNKNIWLLTDALAVSKSAHLGSDTVRAVAIGIDGAYYGAETTKLYKLDSSLANVATWNSGNPVTAPGTGVKSIAVDKFGAVLVANSSSSGDNAAIYGSTGAAINGNWPVTMAGMSGAPYGIFKSNGDAYFTTFGQSAENYAAESWARSTGTEIAEIIPGMGDFAIAMAVDYVNFSSPVIVTIGRSGVYGKIIGVYEAAPTTSIFSEFVSSGGATPYPYCLAIDSVGNIFIGLPATVTEAYTVAKYTWDGVSASLTLVASYDTGGPMLSIAIDEDDNVYAVGYDLVDPTQGERYNIWKFDNDLNFLVGALIDGNTDLKVIATKDVSPPPGTNAPSDTKYSKKLVAVANGEVWYESAAGTMTELAAATGDLTTTSGRLMACEAYQKVFFANGSTFKVADFNNARLDTADILPGGSTAVPVHGEVLTGNGGAVMVTDFITGIDGDNSIYGRIISGAFVNGEVVTGASGVSFTVKTPYGSLTTPFWYTWTPYGNDTTTYGTMPADATIAVLYRGRIVLSGNKYYPYQWWMSKLGDPWDYATTGTTAISAVAGGSSDAGELGDVVIALIPYKDDYLIFGCASTMWYLAGDPMEGGVINELDLTVGIFGPRAWCFDGSGNMYFWGTNGIYKTTIPGTPECINEIRLPNLINDEGADPTTHRITMAYDRRRTGILVCITKMSDGTNSNWWYDLRSGGFFPESYPEECAAYSLFHYAATNNSYKELLFGCRDGYIRKFDTAAKSDDIGASDEAINSYVILGPISLSEDPDRYGKLTLPNLITAGGASDGSQSDSNNVAYKIFTADTAEELLELISANGNPVIGGTFLAPGRSSRNKRTQKTKGVYLGIRLENTTLDESWGFEKFLGTIVQSGRIK